MFVSPVSINEYQTQPRAQSAQEPILVAATGAAGSVEQSGHLDLSVAEKFYREKSGELKNLSNQTGKYEVETLSDSEIKSLRLAGVPIDAFLKQHGQKLGEREYSLLADLIQKSRDKLAVAGADGAASSQATANVTARAYV